MILADILENAAPQKIVCIGDLMLDRFVYGDVHRISPEAPIPILRHRHDIEMLGAVGNVARNVASLGAKAILIGVVGDDADGHRLIELLGRDDNVDGEVISVRGRRTTLKSRFIAHGQQLLRLDSEDVDPVPAQVEDDVIQVLEDEAPDASAILVSDYAKGLLTPRLLRVISAMGQQTGVPVIVDPKGTDFARYGPVDLLKPNASELSTFLGLPCETDQDVETALTVALERVAAKAVLVTRSSKGLSFLERGGAVLHLRGRPQEVFDVSGAGDTSLAALGLGVGSRIELSQAAELALVTSGIAVTKAGTAAVSGAEVMRQLHSEAVPSRSFREFSLEELQDRLDAWRAAGHRVGFTNGCFDILHPGHLSVLEFAKARCDRLIVGLNSDTSVRALKGPTRPVNAQDARARLLLGLNAVDAVVVFDEDTPFRCIETIKPDLLVKGGDYAIDQVVGADVVAERGGEVLIAPLLDGHSTSQIIARSVS